MERLKMPPAEIEHLFYMEAKQSDDILVEDNVRGELLISPMAEGGFFEGEKLKGKIVPVGAGYTLTTPPDRNDIEIRLLLKTEDGADIMMASKGTAFLQPAQEEKMMKGEFVDPADYYYRFNLVFETGSKKYSWLNGKCCFAIVGIKDWETVCYDAYMVK